MTIDEAIASVRRTRAIYDARDFGRGDPMLIAAKVLMEEVERLRTEERQQVERAENEATMLAGTVLEQKAEIARLQASENRLAMLLADALANTPASYSKPILEGLRKNAAKAALEAAKEKR